MTFLFFIKILWIIFSVVKWMWKNQAVCKNESLRRVNTGIIIAVAHRDSSIWKCNREDLESKGKWERRCQNLMNHESWQHLQKALTVRLIAFIRWLTTLSLPSINPVIINSLIIEDSSDPKDDRESDDESCYLRNLSVNRCCTDKSSRATAIKIHHFIRLSKTHSIIASRF